MDNNGNDMNQNVNIQDAQSNMQNEQPKGMAIASMVLGILSLVLACCVPYVPFVLAVLSVIFASIVLSKKLGGKGMAIAGLVCGLISLIPAIIVVISCAVVISALGL